MLQRENKRRSATAGAALSLMLLVGAAACGDDDSGSGGDNVASGVIEVTARDYSFDGMPDTVRVGTQFTLTNAGAEPHELLLIRIPDDETRSIEELIELDDEELFEAFGGEPMPTAVILASPGESDVPGAVMGDGTITEAGRYGVLCFVQVGSPPDLFSSDEEGPELDGAPHAAHGMWAELTVVD